MLGAEPVDAGLDDVARRSRTPATSSGRAARCRPRAARWTVRWRQGEQAGAASRWPSAAPEGTSGTVWLPVDGDRVVKRDGVVVFDGRPRNGARARREDGYVVVGGHTGAHRYAWSARRRG